jgi:hypothetical protein
MDFRPAPLLPQPARPSPLLTTPPGPIVSAQVWPLLSPAQQQILFATLVRACRSLLPVASPTPIPLEEKSHE